MSKELQSMDENGNGAGRRIVGNDEVVRLVSGI